MLYKINDVTISLGGEEILSHIRFEIRGTEKIAVTGRNGAGKTTLLRFIAGELEADRDDKRTEVEIESDCKLNIAMLKQTAGEASEKTIEELFDDYFVGDNRKWEFERIFTGLGFCREDEKRRLSSFSGGEQTRISMIRLFLTRPDILLLDEPTNHLDLGAVEWLEKYLRDYKGAVVFVSHDRFFMDRVADAVYEVDNRKLTRYAGNYSAYREAKRKNSELMLKAWERNEQELHRLNGLIERFKNKPRKAAFARSRKSIIERMEKLEKPAEDSAHIFTGEIVPERMGARWVVNAEHLCCGYRSGGDESVNVKRVAAELSMKLQRGQKIAIIGDNGAGKSTVLKTVIGKLRPLDGKCTLGNEVDIGYFDQMTADISSPMTVIEYFRSRFPNMDDKELRSILASYLFRGRDVMKTVDELSGGEKARLTLAVIISQKPNFLVLDEPTNHMDIEARETLESAFSAFTGTILFVSHDRYLVGKLAESFYILKDGRALFYPFDYSHYLERLERNAELGLLDSEEEALISGLRAVPKREKHEIGFENASEAYEDWQLRLATQELEAARDNLEHATDFEEYERALERLAKAEADVYELSDID